MSRAYEMPKRKSDTIPCDTDLTRESKRAKKGQEDQLKKFLTFAEKEDTLIAGLSFFLTAAERDGGEALVDAYLRKCPECSHLLQPLLWDKQKRSRDVLLVCFSCLEQVLLHTASAESDPVLASVGLQLTQSILSTHMRTVYSSLVTAAPARLICACLCLLSAMVTQGPAAAREVLQGFNFGYKPLGFLLSKTEKIKERQDSIRSCLIKFALSFLMVGAGDTITTILETKSFLSSIFGLLAKDAADIVYLVLSAIKQKVVFNPSVPKKTKSRFFSHIVFKGLSQLLSREDDIIVTADNESEDMKSESTTIKQLTYELMLQLLTDFHYGISYRPKEVPPAGLLRTNNPGLLHATLILSGSLENKLAKKLVLASISTCPDILLPFLKQASITLDLKPVSKWLIGTQFLNELYDQLPAVCELVGTGPSRLTHVDAAVSVTIPSITTRAMLSQWIQSPVLLVKHGVLQLLGTALKRASAVVAATSPTDAVFCQKYSDSLLKSLPDIKTIISLRQLLVSKKLLDTSDANLTAEQATKSKELAKSNTLLSLTMVVMCGYQALCTSLYSQVEFGLHRLLPPLNGSQELDKDSPLLAHEVLLPSLQLLLGAPLDGTRWLNLTVLKTLVLLLLQERDISTLAADLLAKLLSAVEGLGSVKLELELVLKAFVDQKALLTLPEAVDFLVDVFLSYALDSCVYAESVQDILSGGQRSSREEREQQLLNKILASPLDAEYGDSDALQPGQAEYKGTVLPLICCLLTKFTASELNTLVLLVSEAVMQLLLIQDDHRSFVTVVLHCLCTEQFSVKCGGSSWRNLVASLVGHLMCWHPGYYWQIKDRVSLGEVKQLSRKKLLKQLDDQSILPLLGQATEPQLVSLFHSATNHDSGLYNVAHKLCVIRPLKGLFRIPENENDFMLLFLPKLSFASIIVQSICGHELAGNHDPVAGNPNLPSSDNVSGISQKIVDLLSTPVIVRHLKEKLREESSSTHLSKYNAHLMLSLFNKLHCWMSDADCSNGRVAMDSCLSLLGEILQCKSVPEGTDADQSFVLDFLSSKLIQDTMQLLNSWTSQDTELEQGRTIIALLNVLKHCMSRSSVQELLKLLTSSLRSQGGHTQSLQTIVFDMLEVLLCMNVGDLVLDADIVRDLLHAMTQNKHRRLDVVVLALLSGRDKYGITCASDEILCPVHGTGHHPLHQRVVGSCDRCALTTLNSTLKAVLPAVEAKRLMCSDELLRSLRASAAPRSPFCVPVTMQKSIMEYCLESLDGVRAQIVSLLLQSSGAAYKLFKEEGWCERLCQAVRESEGDVCHGQLLVVESYLNLASHDLIGYSSRLLSEVARKRLWKRCLGLLSDPLCLQEHVQSCRNVLMLLCRPVLQGDHSWFIKRVKRMGREVEWKTSGNVAFMTSVGEQLSAAMCKTVMPPSVWNDFAIDIVRNHLNHFDLVHLLAILVRKLYVAEEDGATYLPLEELHEMIWSHPSFTEIMFATGSPDEAIPSAKDGLVELLVAVVGLSPSLCESIQVETMLGAYHATTAKTDQGLLYLLYLCEVNGVSLEQYRPFLWGACALEHYKARQDLGLLLWKQPGPQEVLDLVDRQLLQMSSHQFPLETELEPTDPFAIVESQQETANQLQDTLYDPSFFLPMLSHLLDSGNYVDCRKFVDVGCLGYLFASLCSKSSHVRMAGCHALSRFSTHLDGASFREKAQIVMMFDALKNSLVESNERLPSLFASFLPTVAHILMHPEHHLYRAIAYFLASRATLDLADIPLYRTFLLSSGDQHHQERAWILRILVEGLRCAEDYPIFRKRRALSHIMSLYHLSSTTKEARGLILQLMRKASCVPFVAIDLVWNLGILPWLQQVSLSGEKVVCVEILQSLWKCLKVDALKVDAVSEVAVQDEELDRHKKQVKRPPLLEEELVLTIAATLLNSHVNVV